jgi:hypothetical protein
MNRPFHVVSMQPAEHTVYPATAEEAKRCDLCNARSLICYWITFRFSGTEYSMTVEGTCKVCQSCLDKLRARREIRLVIQRRFTDEEYEAFAERVVQLAEKVNTITLANRLLATVGRDALQSLRFSRILNFILILSLLAMVLGVILR